MRGYAPVGERMASVEEVDDLLASSGSLYQASRTGRGRYLPAAETRITHALHPPAYLSPYPIDLFVEKIYLSLDQCLPAKLWFLSGAGGGRTMAGGVSGFLSST